MDGDEIMRAIDELRSRMDQIEQSRDERHVMIEERTEVAGDGELESSEIAKRDHTTVKTKRIPFCEQCDHMLEGKKFAICHKDGKKLCDECAVDFRNRTICPQHLMEVYPLSRAGFKILIIVANSIDSTDDIHSISHVPKKEAKNLLGILTEGGYIEKSGFFHRRITDVGLEAISGYSQIYGKSADMKQLDEKMREFVQRM